MLVIDFQRCPDFWQCHEKMIYWFGWCYTSLRKKRKKVSFLHVRNMYLETNFGDFVDKSMLQRWGFL